MKKLRIIILAVFISSAVLFPSSAAKYASRTDNYNVTVYAPRYTRIVQVSAGYSHSLAISNTGQLFGWGYNASGRIGDGTITSINVPKVLTNTSAIRFKYIAACEDHSLGIDFDGNVWSWGYGGYGKLGLGNLTSYYSPQLVTFPGSPKFIKVDGTAISSVALDENGNIWTWGSAEYGALGNGTVVGTVQSPKMVTNFGGETPFFVDISGGSYDQYCVLAADSEGNIWGWGRNLYGQVGIVNSVANITSPTKIYTASTGFWTSTSSMQTGANGTIVNLDPGTKMVTVCTGWGLGGSRDENGSIYTWGGNYHGELGLGLSATGSGFPPRRIYNALTGVWLAPGIANFDEPRRIVFFESFASGGLAIDEFGNFFAWGNNDWGQVGVGTLTDVSTPTMIYNATTGQFIGSVSTAPGVKITYANGYRGTILLLSDNNEIFGAGLNPYRQIGDGTVTNRTTYVRISSGIPGSAFPFAVLEYPTV